MCGIVGVRRSICSSRRDVERALRELRWRGPDGARLCEVGDWWLGVARLAITDPRSDQPIVCPRTGRAVALNGAITSAADDWRRFAATARTRNDAELLLLRLEEGGAGALVDITGPYAFAIIDPRDDTLWLGRDPEGEKPLWVAREDGAVVAFASTSTALRALGFDTSPPTSAVARLLRFGYWREADWVADGSPRPVRPLDPGWTRQRGRASEARGTEPRVAPRFETGLGVGPALRAAVERCSQAEVQVGLALSGGIDSACIAACLRDLERGVLGYQAWAVGESRDERERARRVAAHCRMPLCEVDVGPAVLRDLPSLTRNAGVPLGDPSVLAVHALAKRAHRDGVRVLLSGEGADELLLGYARHRAIARLPRHGLSWLPAPGLSTTRRGRAWRALASRDPYDALLEVAPPAFRRAVLVPEFQDRGMVAAFAAERPELRCAGGLQRARVIDRAAYLRGDLLPKLDTATMAAGVEGRCPFLDPEVLACRDTNDADPRRILGKRALRAAFGPELPAGHLDQPKRGFAVPLDRWWREDEFLADLLLEARTLQRGHLRAGGVREMLDLHRCGRARVGHALYLLVAWELFVRTTEETG